MLSHHRPRLALLLLAYLAFVSLGLPDGLLGVGWPSIRSDFAVPTAAVGIALTAATAGYLAASVVAGFTIARLGVGWLLAGSTTLAALALVGIGLSPGLAAMTGCAVLLGLGSGAIDSGLNAYAAAAFGPRHMNWLHAFFGFGVALGPLTMTVVLGAGLPWRWGYGLVAAAQLALAAAFALTASGWRADQNAGGSAAIGSAPPAVRRTLALAKVWSGMLTFALYAAVEVATGLWAFLLLTEERGLATAVAGSCVAGYWGSLFVGRVVQGVAAERLGTGRVLAGSMAGMAAGSALVAVPAPAWVAVTGLAVIGFAAAPVFPLLVLGTARRVGPAHADRAIGLQIGAACLGGAGLPALIGLLLSRAGAAALGPALLALTLAMIVAHAASVRPARRLADAATG